MPITEWASGTATVGTGQLQLVGGSPEAADGILQVLVDCTKMVSGAVLEVRITDKVRSSGTQRTVWLAVLADAQASDDSVFVSPALLVMHGWEVTLAMPSGGGSPQQEFDYSVRLIT